MKKNCIFFVLIAVIFIGGVYGEKLAALSDLLVPDFMAVDNSQVYVAESTTVFIFSMKDFKLVSKFGKPGEGPQEFMKSVLGFGGISIFPLDDSLGISSVGKFSFYKKNGEYIKEMKAPSMFAFGSYNIPIEKGFVGMNMGIDQQAKKTKLFIILFDDKFNKRNTIATAEFNQQANNEFPSNSPRFQVWKDKIISVDTTGVGFGINIYNSDGKKITTITRNYPLIKVTEKYKKDVYSFYDKTPLLKQYPQLKQQVTFKDRCPAIQDIIVSDGNIYAQTYLEKDGKYEFFIFNINGKFIKTTFLPVFYRYGIIPGPKAIKNNKLYYIIENDEEECELHVVNI